MTKKMLDFRYSKTIFYLAEFLVLLNLLDYFVNQNFLLFPSAISLIILLVINISDDVYLKKVMNNIRLHKFLKFLALICLSLILFFSSIDKLIDLFYLIPVEMQYFLLIPVVVLIILITGAITGIIYKIYEIIYK